MPERKYMSHNSKNCTGARTKCPIKNGMGGPIGSRYDFLQQYRNSKNKWNKDLKSLKKKTRCYIVFPVNHARAVKSRRSRRPGQNLLGRLASLPAMIGVPIHR